MNVIWGDVAHSLNYESSVKVLLKVKSFTSALFNIPIFFFWNLTYDIILQTKIYKFIPSRDDIYISTFLTKFSPQTLSHFVNTLLSLLASYEFTFIKQ